jgi:hypothetical protein
MENFIRHFVRIESGKWTCVRPGEFTGPDGKRIQVAIGSTFTRGTNFMGVDLAQWLDEEQVESTELSCQTGAPKSVPSE